MKLDIWEVVSSLLDAGGIFQYGRYEIRDSNGNLHREDGPAMVLNTGTGMASLTGMTGLLLYIQMVVGIGTRMASVTGKTGLL